VAINVAEIIASVNGCWTILNGEWLEQYFVCLSVCSSHTGHVRLINFHHHYFNINLIALTYLLGVGGGIS